MRVEGRGYKIFYAGRDRDQCVGLWGLEMNFDLQESDIIILIKYLLWAKRYQVHFAVDRMISSWFISARTALVIGKQHQRSSIAKDVIQNLELPIKDIRSTPLRVTNSWRTIKNSKRTSERKLFLNSLKNTNKSKVSQVENNLSTFLRVVSMIQMFPSSMPYLTPILTKNYWQSSKISSIGNGSSEKNFGKRNHIWVQIWNPRCRN